MVGVGNCHSWPNIGNIQPGKSLSLVKYPTDNIQRAFEVDMTVPCYMIVLFILCLGQQVSTTRQISLANRHFKIGAHAWPPLLVVEKNHRVSEYQESHRVSRVS